jgi:hypothetical protein
MLDLYWTTVGTFEPRQMFEDGPRPVRAAAPVEHAEDAPVRITRQWRRLEQAILRALEPFEEACEAVARALAAVEPLPDAAT